MPPSMHALFTASLLALVFLVRTAEANFNVTLRLDLVSAEQTLASTRGVSATPGRSPRFVEARSRWPRRR